MLLTDTRIPREIRGKKWNDRVQVKTLSDNTAWKITDKKKGV
jgi:hypothetical protein